MVKLEDCDPLTEEKIDEIFARRKVILRGHFVYSAGGHGDVYIDKSEITFWPKETSILCREIARQWRNFNVEVVVGPAIGGIKLADRVAEWLTNFLDREIPALYTEKENRKQMQILKRGRDKVIGKNVLIVEDIINTGKSAKETVSACCEAGANVVGCHALVNRNPGIVTAKTLGVPKLLALKEMKVVNYSAEECPFCARRIPISTDRGHGAEYLKKHPEKANW